MSLAKKCDSNNFKSEHSMTTCLIKASTRRARPCNKRRGATEKKDLLEFEATSPDENIS